MTRHLSPHCPDPATATWRRLRHLVRVAPALLLTACLVPLLAMTDGALAPVSLAVVRALLDVAPDHDLDQDALPREQRADAGLRPAWSPESRPQPMAAAVAAQIPHPVVASNTDVPAAAACDSGQSTRDGIHTPSAAAINPSPTTRSVCNALIRAPPAHA